MNYEYSLLASMTAVSMPVVTTKETMTDHLGSTAVVAADASTFMPLLNAKMEDEG